MNKFRMFGVLVQGSETPMLTLINLDSIESVYANPADESQTVIRLRSGQVLLNNENHETVCKSIWRLTGDPE